MDHAKEIIEEAWEKRTALSPSTAPRRLRDAVEQVISALDAGRLRVAEKAGGEWLTHQWIKKAVLLSFRLHDNRVIDGGATRYEQGVYLAPQLSKGLMRCDSQSTVRHNCGAKCGGYDFDGIDGKSARILSAEHFGGPSKDLKWPDEIENLSSRPRDEHDPTCSRLTWHTGVI